MLSRSIFFILFLLNIRLQAQVFATLNAGPLLGRGLEAFISVQPKNEDWLLFSAGGGATLRAPFFLSFLKEDCLKKFRNGGWDVFISARNNLTGDHHKSHLFWGLKMILAHQREIAIAESCYPIQGTLDRRGWVLGGAAMAGYSVLLTPQSVDKKLFWDIGLQTGIPLYRQQQFLSPLNYVSGLGYGKTGNQGINFELIFALRYELIHGKYGFSKPGKVKR